MDVASDSMNDAAATPDVPSITDMQAEQSIYEPLDGNSIRLLVINAALPDEEIECRLIQPVNLKTAPDFEALSYV